MFNPKNLDDLAKRLADVVPPAVKDLQNDLEKNFKVVLQGALARLDMVTREEFDVQKQVLLHTRQKLEALEQHVARLEAELGATSRPE